jgi:hypothetical protein
MTDTTPIRSTIASCRTFPHLDARHPGRYQRLDAHHAALRSRLELARDRAVLAVEVTRRRAPPADRATPA